MKEGKVISHSKDKSEIYEKLLSLKGKSLYIEYTGRIPEDLSVVLHFVGEILINKLKEIELDNPWKDDLVRISQIYEEIEPEVTWSRYPGIDKGALWIPYEEYTSEDAHKINPAPSCGALNPAGRLYLTIQPALFIVRGFIPTAELRGILEGAG